MMNTIKWPGQQELQAWRHDFHRHPETAFQEHRTSARVAELLRSWGLEVHTGLAGTGVVAVLKGRLGDGPSIGLRADMDALHVQELNTCDHASQHAGRMHACGHDGHTSMLLGAAKVLAADPEFAGTVHFIFQPAEENEGGARAMIEDGLFQRFPVDEIFGIGVDDDLDALVFDHAKGVQQVGHLVDRVIRERHDFIMEARGGHFLGRQQIEFFGLTVADGDAEMIASIGRERFEIGGGFLKLLKDEEDVLTGAECVLAVVGAGAIGDAWFESS